MIFNITKEEARASISQRFEGIPLPDKCEAAEQVLDLLNYVDKYELCRQLTVLQASFDTLSAKIRSLIEKTPNDTLDGSVGE